MSNDFELLKEINFGQLSEAELIDLYYCNKDKYRTLLNLVQNPRFPEKFAINILPKMFPVDLLRIVKNKKTRPGVRIRAEQEFMSRYERLPLGEKISLLKIAPYSLLIYLVEENDERILKTMLSNPYCTTDLILRMINRQTSRFTLYQVMCITDWYKRPSVAEAILNDKEASIRIILEIFPLLTTKKLKQIYQNPDTHQVVKDNISRFLKGNNCQNPQ